VSDPLAFVHDELKRLEDASLLRTVRTLDSAQEPEVSLDGRRVILLASNNYLGLAADPRVVEAAAEAARRWGAGSGSARLISGGVRLHDELESRLAAFKGTEAALLFSSGYLANLGTISALVGRGDAIFSDELNHASIIDGARLSGANVHIYRHADPSHLRDLLKASTADRSLVVTDAVFSMDGDLAPLAPLAGVCDEHGAILMVDEAHATGVIGPSGRGAVAAAGLAGRVPVVMGTLSKALGSAGGFIAGSSALISLLRNRARSFIFDTAPPAPVAAAALKALEILDQEPWRSERAHSLASRLARGLRDAGFDAGDPAAAIVPVRVGKTEAALALSRELLAQGVLIPAIRPPSVAPGTARLRATVMATHTDDQIDTAVRAFAATHIGVG
jgi:8-amino-7-oxononanoate synthase